MTKRKPAEKLMKPLPQNGAPLISRSDYEKLLKAAHRLPVDRKRDLLSKIEEMIRNPGATQESLAMHSPLGAEASMLIESFNHWLESARALPLPEQAALNKRVLFTLETRPLAGDTTPGTNVPRRNNQKVYFDRLVKGAVKLPEGWKVIFRDTLKAEIDQAAAQ